MAVLYRRCETCDGMVATAQCDGCDGLLPKHSNIWEAEAVVRCRTDSGHQQELRLLLCPHCRTQPFALDDLVAKAQRTMVAATETF